MAAIRTTAVVNAVAWPEPAQGNAVVEPAREHVITAPRMRSIFRLLLAALPLGGADLFAATTAPFNRDAFKLYADFCSGCHGEKMEGGKGPALIGGAWKHGGDDASLRRSIRQGYPEAEMPAFGKTINEAETRALIAYIHEMTTRSVDPQPREEQPLPVGIQHSEDYAYRIEPVAAGLDVPWSMAFLPDGRMLVTERVGRLRVIDHGKLQPEPIRDVPPVVVRDEAGLMSVVADPDFAQNGWIYLSLSDPGPDDSAMTKIVRGRLRDGAFVDQQTVFAIPRAQYQRNYVLFGGRMVFQGDYLFFSVGERGMHDGITGQAQDLTRPNGKIHRVFRDGHVPPDNPFVHQAGAFASIWAYGMRNPQGLAIDPRNGALWETEHGPRGGDELNRVRRGRNYGWPVITYGMNYDGTPVSAKTAQRGMEQPVLYWTPSIATSEIEFYRGDRFPKWKNNLFLGSLGQQKFLRLVVEGDRVVHREEVFHGLGRVRDIKTGPDGLLYVALELIGKPGRIVRLVPAE
jgi:glucose/arabinose dehydrogenase